MGDDLPPLSAALVRRGGRQDRSLRLRLLTRDEVRRIAANTAVEDNRLR